MKLFTSQQYDYMIPTVDFGEIAQCPDGPVLYFMCLITAQQP